MRDVQVGDLLIDERGEPTRVVAATEVMHDRPCYRVTFRDGSSVVADAEHLWPMDEFTGASRRRVLVTTEDMLNAGVRYERPLTQGRTKCTTSGVARWRTLPTPPLDNSDVKLPLPPYLLGYWLGDGDRDCPRVTIHRDDISAFLSKCEQLGVEAGEPSPTHGETFRIRFGGAPGRGGVVGRNGKGWATAALREAGLLFNKHIPPQAMRASYKQRLELLRGLMDSDGTIDSKGKIELCLTDQRLACEAMELMRTLGLYPRMKASDAVLHGQVVGTRYRINVTAYSDEPIFSLPRKASRMRPRGSQMPYSQARTVVSIEPVESVPVRCVSVSGPSSLYLAGEGLVPTHNSPFAAVLALAEFTAPVRIADFDPAAPGGVRGKPVDMPLVQIAATAESQTANTMRMVRALAAKASPLARAYGIDVGKTQYYKQPEGTLQVITSSANAAEGAESSCVIADETEHWKPSNGGPDLAATLADNLTKSGNRMLETCNAWVPGVGSVAEASWDAWVAQEEGKTRGESKILYDARVAPPDTDMSDPESLQPALEFVYEDCFWQKIRPIMERIWDPRSSPDDSRRKYLNQPTAAIDAWTTPQAWSALADPSELVADGDEIVAFFDGSKSRDATALIGCRVSDGYVFTIGVWEPDTSHDTESVVPVAEVDAAVEQMFDQWTVLAFFADVKEWEGFTKVTWPGRYADRLLVHAVPEGKDPQPIAWDMRSRTYDFTLACELTETEIEERTFRHDGDSRVSRHVGNARRRPNRYGVSIGKESPDSPKKIDAAVCVIGARMVRRLVLASPKFKSRAKKARTGRVYGFN
jgi:hypothetical protein